MKIPGVVCIRHELGDIYIRRRDRKRFKLDDFGVSYIESVRTMGPIIFIAVEDNEKIKVIGGFKVVNAIFKKESKTQIRSEEHLLPEYYI